jgi:hypothetical protein
MFIYLKLYFLIEHYELSHLSQQNTIPIKTVRLIVKLTVKTVKLTVKIVKRIVKTVKTVKRYPLGKLG